MMSETNTIDILGDDQASKQLIERTISSFIDDNVTSIGSNAFRNCSNLTDISFPAVTSIGVYAFNGCTNLTDVFFPALTFISSYAFDGCTNLTNVSFPVATSISGNAFGGCKKLTDISFPVLTSIDVSAFTGCTSLTDVSFPAVRSIGRNAFQGCTNLTKVVLGNTDQVAILAHANAFTSAGNAIIYVPDALVDSYKSENNWSTLASRIKGISEIPST